jgi:hypothetical protein
MRQAVPLNVPLNHLIGRRAADSRQSVNLYPSLCAGAAAGGDASRSVSYVVDILRMRQAVPLNHLTGRRTARDSKHGVNLYPNPCAGGDTPVSAERATAHLRGHVKSLVGDVVLHVHDVGLLQLQTCPTQGQVAQYSAGNPFAARRATFHFARG